MGSQMHLKYIHYFGNESKESILEVHGYDQVNDKCEDESTPQLPYIVNTF